METLFSIMLSITRPVLNYQDQDIKTREEFLEKVVKPSMVYKFYSGKGLQFFEKIFENEDVVILRLK